LQTKTRTQIKSGIIKSKYLFFFLKRKSLFYINKIVFEAFMEAKNVFDSGAAIASP
jgi:hypothetical protein